MNLVLIGMMGCGKSTCARMLSRALGCRFVDTDSLIEQREGRSISDIFARDGEEYFRDVESSVARELSCQDGLVIATGGGIILREENVTELRKNGFLVWLNRPPEEIFDSVSMAGRPLAQDGKAAFLTRFAQREEKYRSAAHLEVKTLSTPQATVDHILTRWKAITQQKNADTGGDQL